MQMAVEDLFVISPSWNHPPVSEWRNRLSCEVSLECWSSIGSSRLFRHAIRCLNLREMRLSERRQIKREILYGYIYVNDKKLKISLAVESRSVATVKIMKRDRDNGQYERRRQDFNLEDVRVGTHKPILTQLSFQYECFVMG